MKFKGSHFLLLTALLISSSSYAGLSASEALIAGEETTVKTLQEKGQILGSVQDKKHIRHSNSKLFFLNSGVSGEDVFEYEEAEIEPDEVEGLPQASYDTELPSKKEVVKQIHKKKHHFKTKRKAKSFKSNCDI